MQDDGCLLGSAYMYIYILTTTYICTQKQVLNNHYPERVNRILIVNAPRSVPTPPLSKQPTHI